MNAPENSVVAAPRPDLDSAAPRFSIVIPVLNRVDVIDRCLRNLLDQRGSSFELIVIDGGSTDGTVDVIRHHAPALAHWESKRDEGIYHAWNKGLTRARGTWIGFIGADDRFATDDLLATLADTVATLPPEVTIIYPHALYVDDEGLTHGESGTAWHVAKPRLFQGMMTVPPGVFYRRDVFERTGLFDTSFRICGDFDMVLREAQTHEARYVDSASVIVGVGGVSWHIGNRLRIMEETRASLRKNGITGVPWAWYLAYLRMTPAYLRTRRSMGRILRRLGLLPARNRQGAA